MSQPDAAEPVLAGPGGGEGQQRHGTWHAANAGTRPWPPVQPGVLRTGRQQPGHRVEVRSQGPRCHDGQLGLGTPGRAEYR